MTGVYTQADPDAAILVTRHLDLLERLGWWDESEMFLTYYGRPVLDDSEYRRRLGRILEKQRIYRKAAAGPLDGRSFIGNDDVVRLVKGPVTLSYHLKDTNIDIALTYRSLLRVMKLVEECLAYVPKQVHVDLHGDASELHIYSDGLKKKDRRAGLYTGRIHLRASAFHGIEPQKMTVIVSHEYVHQAVADLSGKKAPRWLDEGLAVHLSQELSDAYAQTLTDAVADERVFPLEALDGEGLFEAAGSPAVLAYAQAYSLTDFLLERIDWEGMRRLLAGIRRDGPERALGIFSLNYYLLEREWKRWVQPNQRT